MKKLLAFLLITGFFMPLASIRSEVEVEISNQIRHSLSAPLAGKVTYYEKIPSKPVLYGETLVYRNPDLTEYDQVIVPGDKALEIEELTYNKAGTPIFRLKGGQYLEASQNLVYDDIILSQGEVSQTFYLLPDFEVYQEPYTLGVAKAKHDLKSYQELEARQEAKTQSGVFYWIENQGWISEAFLSSEDIRMTAVQELLDKKYSKPNLSIYVKSMVTQEVAESNADQEMYTASISKLATLYYTQKQVDKGNLSWSSKFKYSKETEDYKGAYDSEGIDGGIPYKPDNKDYRLDDLVKAMTKVSDNAATNVVGYYATNRYDQTFQASMVDAIGETWDMKERRETARTAGLLMEAIYYQDGKIIDYMSDTKFDKDRISKTIPVQVAHKTGDAYEFRHDVAIVYADQPFVLSIFTDKSSYDEISKIAQDVYGILN